METVKERTAAIATPCAQFANNSGFHICDASGDLIATLSGAQSSQQKVTTAALIVRAVNSFPKLVEALKYYANPETHKSRVLGSEWGAPVETDKGEVARTALSEAAVGEDTSAKP